MLALIRYAQVSGYFIYGIIRYPKEYLKIFRCSQKIINKQLRKGISFQNSFKPNSELLTLASIVS